MCCSGWNATAYPPQRKPWIESTSAPKPRTTPSPKPKFATASNRRMEDGAAPVLQRFEHRVKTFAKVAQNPPRTQAKQNLIVTGPLVTSGVKEAHPTFSRAL